MEIRFKYADGREVTANVLPVDRIMFERTFSLSVMGAVQGEQREEHFLWLGWHALQRTGQADPDFDKWLLLVADYGTGTEPEVPSGPVANTGS